MIAVCGLGWMALLEHLVTWSTRVGATRQGLHGYLSLPDSRQGTCADL